MSSCITINAENFITITTTKSIGSMIDFSVVANRSDRIKVWVDLNNNQVQDKGEQITEFDTEEVSSYCISSQTFSIYGNITHLNCADQKLSTLDISNDATLTDLNCSGNQLTNLNISNNELLQTLNCNNNKLLTLNIINNSDLITVDCSYTQLSNLDVSKNSELKNLFCYNNNISELDIANNALLENFDCSNNAINNLDIKSNIELESLKCNSNHLVSLNTTSNTSLTILACSLNKIETLNLTKNTQLDNLKCSSNQLTHLDVSKNSLLMNLFCSKNKLASLDLSHNIELAEIFCFENPLTSLNIANTYNGNIDIIKVTDCPKLTCIRIDENFEPTESWRKDATANWSSTPCRNDITSTDNINKHSINVWTKNECIYISNLELNQQFTITDVSGKLMTQQQANSTEVEINLPQGFYIVNTNNQSFKMMVKK